MNLIQRLLRCDKRLDELNNDEFRAEYKEILKYSATKLYLKLNQFEKKIGVK